MKWACAIQKKYQRYNNAKRTIPGDGVFRLKLCEESDATQTISAIIEPCGQSRRPAFGFTFNISVQDSTENWLNY